MKVVLGVFYVEDDKLAEYNETTLKNDEEFYEVLSAEVSQLLPTAGICLINSRIVFNSREEWNAYEGGYKFQLSKNSSGLDTIEPI